jgi:two-component system invasion response regulator UvrY
MIKQLNRVAIADETTLFRKGLRSLINSFEGYKVILEAKNSVDLENKLTRGGPLPHICILNSHVFSPGKRNVLADIKRFRPSIKILVIADYHNDFSIAQLIRMGGHGYLLKSSTVNELKHSLNALNEVEFYIDKSIISSELLVNIQNNALFPKFKISELQLEFLSLCAQDLTYYEIADIMGVSLRSVNSYCETLFKKFNVKSRTGLVLFAITLGVAGQVSYGI